MEAPPSSLEFPSDDDEPQTTTKDDRELARDTLAVSTSNVARGSPRGSPKEYLLAPPPIFPHHPTSRAIPSFHPSTENNLLAQAWYFAAQATHVPHNKVGKVARRVIIRIAKVLRNEPFSLEIVHDVVSKCHRTQAEGLLDRVLAAREKPVSTSMDTTQSQDVQRREKAKEPCPARGKEEEEEVGKKDLRSSPQPYTPFPETRRKQRGTKQGSPHVGVASGEGGASDNRRLSEYGSDDSYRSAVSDLSVEEKEDQGEPNKREVRREVPGSEIQSSSDASSDSKSDDRQPKDSTSGGIGDDVTQLPRWVWPSGTF